MKQSVFYIAQMDCPTEEQLIRNRLSVMEGIDTLDFDLIQRKLTVTHTLDGDAHILSALETLGLGAILRHPDENGAHQHTVSHLEGAPAVPVTRWVLLGVSGIAALSAEVLHFTTGEEGSVLVIALALLSIISGGRETLKKGLIALQTFTLNINFLMSIAIAGAIAIGHWPEAAMVTFLFAVAEAIEAYSLDHARNAIRGLMEMAPDLANVLSETGEWVQVPVSEVAMGQTVRVKPGERVPLDGIVTSGRSSVNQAPITGESLPVDKGRGDTVFAGTINQLGSLEFEVTANKGHTTLDRIIRSVQEAQAQRAPTQRFVDIFARYYTPAVVLLAIFIAIGPTLIWGEDFREWLYRSLVMLVIACPCALVISTPVTVVSGLAVAARRGILVKGGKYLELGRKLRTVALDKTGTLTHGRPEVTDFIILNSREPADLIHIAASLNAHSEHPIASAIVAYWLGADHSTPGSSDPDRLQAVRKSSDLLPVSNFISITGQGVRGEIDGKSYFIGNHSLAEDSGVCGPHVESELQNLERQGKSAIVLGSMDEPLAVFGVADDIRKTSVDAVGSLHRLGVKTVMLSGDNQVTVDAIGQRVNIDDARGNLMPDDKLSAIGDLQEKRGVIGMVGDGINDAPALARASIGFAMGAAGTDTALETADVALMEDDLRKLPEFIDLSRRTSRILAQNITIAIGIKAVFFALALAGKATLWMAVFADMGASLIVVFNGLRLLRYRGLN